MFKNEMLQKNGFIVVDFPVDECVLNFLESKNWLALDQHFLEMSKPGGALRLFLSHYLDFQTLEHIINIRSGPDDDEGIWHDDGSRFLGFSLSLNRLPPSIQGGELRFRPKGQADYQSFSPLPFGKMVIFLSGIYGYEHMVSAVTQGTRIVIAGWCS